MQFFYHLKLIIYNDRIFKDLQKMNHHCFNNDNLIIIFFINFYKIIYFLKYFKIYNTPEIKMIFLGLLI